MEGTFDIFGMKTAREIEPPAKHADIGGTDRVRERGIYVISWRLSSAIQFRYPNNTHPVHNYGRERLVFFPLEPS
jgi:hypothetical protein